MAKRSIIKKLSKEQKSLLIGLLLGDGTISSNCVFKLSHSEAQREYLEWKVGLLDVHGIKNNGVKEYISSCGYNTGKKVLYSQMSLNPTIKALRRTVYTPKKHITRKLLNWITPLGLAIWYMDDGGLGVKKRNGKIHAFDLILNTHTTTDQNQIMIDYFKEVWDVQFTQVKNKGHYRLRCGTKEAKKFIQIVKPFILPMFAYKIDPLETRPNSNSVYNVDTSAQHPQLRG